MQDGCFLCKRNLSLSIRGSLCWPGWRCFQNACLAAKELLKASNCFTLKNNSPKKLAKAASSGGNFAILVHSLVQHLAWGPLRQSGILLARFGRPKPVGPSYPLEQEKSQLRVWAVLHARFLCLVWYILTFLLQVVVFNEENALLKHGTRRFAIFGGFEVFNGPPREVDSTQPDATGPAGFFERREKLSFASGQRTIGDHSLFMA